MLIRDVSVRDVLIRDVPIRDVPVRDVLIPDVPPHIGGTGRRSWRGKSRRGGG